MFFLIDTATTEIYALPLHAALPISPLPASTPMAASRFSTLCAPISGLSTSASATSSGAAVRSEEHTSELQSQSNLVCRLLLEKKNLTLALDRRVRSDVLQASVKWLV